MRNVDVQSYVTPVKRQDPWGTCRGFSAIAAAETSILWELRELGYQEIPPEALDLSERHLAWFTRTAISENDPNFSNQGGEGIIMREGAPPLDTGGSTFLATSIFSSGFGPV